MARQRGEQPDLELALEALRVVVGRREAAQDDQARPGSESEVRQATGEGALGDGELLGADELLGGGDLAATMLPWPGHRHWANVKARA